MAAAGGQPDPDRAFWLLSDATRVDILRAIWAADEPLSFSTIRERVGNPNSGRFNYHLGELRDHFVTKGEDGYRLSQAGREVVRAVLAGTITTRPQVEATPIEGECEECGASLAVRYDEYCIVECTDCGATVMWNEFPPAGLSDRTPQDVAATFDAWTRARFHLAMDGICPNCASHMSTERVIDDDGAVATTHRCGTCRYEARTPLYGHVIRHPAVVSYFYDQGIDITSIPYWELRTLARDFEATVWTDDPWTASLTIGVAGDGLRLTIDEQLSVTAVERLTT